MSGDLAAFLAARLDEDEQVAKGLEGATRFIGGEPDFYGVGGPAAAAFWGHFTPARVRAEVAAKRATLAEYEQQLSYEQLGEHEDSREMEERDWDRAQLLTLEGVVKRDAAVYSGHPDYKPAWAPSPSQGARPGHEQDIEQQGDEGAQHGTGRSQEG